MKFLVALSLLLVLTFTNPTFLGKDQGENRRVLTGTGVNIYNAITQFQNRSSNNEADLYQFVGAVNQTCEDDGYPTPSFHVLKSFFDQNSHQKCSQYGRPAGYNVIYLSTYMNVYDSVLGYGFYVPS